MSHVFISYSRKDTAFAQRLLQRFDGSGYEVWMDSILPAGFDWRQEIDQAIRQAFVVLVVVSPDSKISEYVTYEWAFALGLGIKVIPLVLAHTPLHPRLESVQHIDFTDPQYEEQAWQRLIESLQHIQKAEKTISDPLREALKNKALGTTKMDAPGVWLSIQQGPQQGQEWNLNTDVITLGREISNDIVINDQQVSRRHVQFTRGSNNLSFLVTDLGSSNGTFVNEEPLEETRSLKHGDIIRLGESITLIYQVVINVDGRRVPIT